VLAPMNITMLTVLVGVGHPIFRPTGAKQAAGPRMALRNSPSGTVMLSGPA
jgi:hypothetical protein